VNSEQLRLFINGAFGNEADARAVRRKLEPYLKLTLAEIREIVEQLAETSLTRQKDWRALLSLVEEALMPYNDALAIELTEQLPASGLAARQWVSCCRRDDFAVEVSDASYCWWACAS
jgi:hypothetical protein